MMTDPEDAQRALDSLRQTRAEMADRPTPNGLYGLAYGAVCGLMVGGQGLPQPWGTVSVAIGVSGVAVLVHWWKRKTGYWISGTAPKRARWATIGLCAVMLGLMAFNIWHRGAHGGWIVPVVTGVTAGIAAIVASEIWMRVWRHELKAGRE